MTGCNHTPPIKPNIGKEGIYIIEAIQTMII